MRVLPWVTRRSTFGAAARALGGRSGFFFVAFVAADLCGEVIWNGGSLRVAGIQA